MSKFARYGKTSSMAMEYHDINHFIERQLENMHVDESTTIPNTIKLLGTVKVHGSNFGVSLDSDGRLRFQTRENYSDPEHNNFRGFKSLFIETIGEDKLISMLKPHIGDADRIAMYGELFGEGIQKGVAVSKLPISYMVFSLTKLYQKEFEDDVYHTINGIEQVKHKKGETYFEKENLDISLLPSLPELRFYKSIDFMTFEEEINLTDYNGSFDRLMKHTLAVEERCPVGCSIDPNLENTTGEGIVWSGHLDFNGKTKFIKFKTKGDKHKRGKGGLKQEIEDNLSDEQKDALKSFYDKALTIDRLEQGFEFLEATGQDIEMKNIPVYVKWIATDIKEELKLELDELEQLIEMDTKKIMKTINKKASSYFIKRFNDNLVKS